MNSESAKIALVTGASAGIGRSVSLGLIEEGWKVILAARRKEVLDNILSQHATHPDSAMAVATDVSNPESVRHLFNIIREKFGRLDLLFNNAGISLPSTEVEDYTYEDWQKVLDINVTGSFLCTQEAFKIMKAQTPKGGRIINNGSLSAHTPRALSAAYTVSKHAITGLTRSTALDGRKYGIACGQIDIGNADTDMASRMHDGVIQADGNLSVEPTIPVERITDTVLYMAGLPLDTNVLFLTVMAAGMPFVGRG